MLHALILAGGSGTRLWPASRKKHPKHLLVFEQQTLLQTTIDRLNGLVAAENTWIVTNQDQSGLIAETLPLFDAQHILAEPIARNTAAGIGWAAAKLQRIDPDAVMIVLPADHIIKPIPEFCKTLRTAVEIVNEEPEQLITIGIKPAFPATSYGYIQRGDAVNTLTSAYYVHRFCEKPMKEIAETFCNSGDFYWNAGIFVWKVKTILELLHRFEPDIGSEIDFISKTFGTAREASATEESFKRMKSISIDYAVMERAEDVIVLEAGFDWNDVGTWSALDRLYQDQKDAAGNLAINSQLLAIDSANCTVRCDDPKHLIALAGLHDIVVIQTADATLIARKDQEDSIRQITEELKKSHSGYWE